jgi:hypothetical protein
MVRGPNSWRRRLIVRTARGGAGCRKSSVYLNPKFHCEMNFIERFWCGAKWYSRENCSYSFEGLRATVPKALDSVSTASIHRYYKLCERTIEAYAAGMSYGTEEFAERVYKGHRQVVDKSKW